MILENLLPFNKSAIDTFGSNFLPIMSSILTIMLKFSFGLISVYLIWRIVEFIWDFIRSVLFFKFKGHGSKFSIFSGRDEHPHIDDAFTLRKSTAKEYFGAQEFNSLEEANRYLKDRAQISRFKRNMKIDSEPHSF